jgi:hypothetical protein
MPLTVAVTAPASLFSNGIPFYLKVAPSFLDFMFSGLAILSSKMARFIYWQGSAAGFK